MVIHLLALTPKGDSRSFVPTKQSCPALTLAGTTIMSNAQLSSPDWYARMACVVDDVIGTHGFVEELCTALDQLAWFFADDVSQVKVSGRLADQGGARRFLVDVRHPEEGLSHDTPQI